MPSTAWPHAARNTNRDIKEDKVRGIYVKGLREVYVTSPEQTMDVMRAGAANRAVGATSTLRHQAAVLLLPAHDSLTPCRQPRLHVQT